MSTFSYKWYGDDDLKEVRIEIYENGTLKIELGYPEGGSLVPADITAYCEAAVIELERDRANTLITEARAAVNAAYDAAAPELATEAPPSPVSLSAEDVSAAILVDVKAEILEEAIATSANPYSLVGQYQAEYDAIGVDVDVYSLVFEGYGAAIKVELYNDADGDGVKDAGETVSGLPGGSYLRVWSDLTDASVYTDFYEQNGMLLGYGFTTGAHMYAIFPLSGYTLTGGALTKQVTLTDNTVKDEGTRGVYDMVLTGTSLGGFTAHTFGDTNGNGTQDGVEADNALVPVIVTLTGPLGGRAYLPDAAGDYNVTNDLLPDVGGYVFDISRPATYSVTNAGALTVPHDLQDIVANAQTAFGDWGIVLT